jgi:phage FluMu protein Com
MQESERLKEVRCRCGALLCKASGKAVIESKCPRCRSIVKAEIDEKTQRFEVVKANWCAAND